MLTGKRKRRADFEKYAEDAFVEHILTPEQTEGPVKMWLCHKPGTGIYHFRVISAPGMIAVYGDVGDNILMASDKDLIPWLRSSVKSPEYLMSKISGAYQHKEFVEEQVEDMFTSMLADAGYDSTLTGEEAEEQEDDLYIKSTRKTIRETKENWDHNYDGKDGHSFCRAFCEAGGDTEALDSLFDYNSDALWTLGCLKKFIELLDKGEVK